MDSWYEEMERAEQEYDAHQQDMADAYKSGYNAGIADGETMACSEGGLRSAYEQGKEEGIAKGRADAIDEYKNALHKEFEKADKKLLHWIDFVEMYNKVAEQLKENKNEY